MIEHKKLLKRLVLTLRPGDSVLVDVATGHQLVIRRDKRDKNKFFFEEHVCKPTEKPYFRIIRRGADLFSAWMAKAGFHQG